VLDWQLQLRENVRKRDIEGDGGVRGVVELTLYEVEADTLMKLIAKIRLSKTTGVR
jgi:hypothetical protein